LSCCEPQSAVAASLSLTAGLEFDVVLLWFFRARRQLLVIASERRASVGPSTPLC